MKTDTDTAGAPHLLRPFRRWVLPAAIVVFVLFAAGLIVAVLGLIQGEHDQAVVAAERHATIQQLSKNNDALRAQVQKLGQKPVAPPAAQIIAEAGANGLNGVNGTNGSNGRGVVSFTCQSDSTWLILYTDATSQTVAGPCFGATGATGAAGKDSTVPGPAGATGSTGTAGQPPASWTFTDEVGVAYTCTRTDPFDASAPTYSCSKSN